MGHYRSEMISDEDHKRESDLRKKQRNELAAKIQKKIEEEGIEFVLADIYESSKPSPRWYFHLF